MCWFIIREREAALILLTAVVAVNMLVDCNELGL
jgi:hypothetical protein